MRINGTAHRSIALCADGWAVEVIDQRQLPWRLEITELRSAAMVLRAIREMWVRGAPLIGATAAYGLCLGLREDASDQSLQRHYQLLLDARPTAVNLQWALRRVREAAAPHQGQQRIEAAYASAAAICEEDVRNNQRIGEHGLKLIRAFARRERAVNVLTHCNAGALATVDFGTALAPIYRAHEAGIAVHVWVDETRPRNQGALLTAYELSQQGIAHTVIADNAGGLLMQQGRVDLCLVGADRVARNGDVCNKIGTYLKALAAHDNRVPFYVALPFSTFDASLASGADIVIEERAAAEVTEIQGQGAGGELATVRLTESVAANPAFDITPARLVRGYVTEKGVLERLDSAA
ncbi:MAG TPA: S-methyl-5-thioribose-1-phosphate isomerase [Steroidobacteraceae bacterium]